MKKILSISIFVLAFLIQSWSQITLTIYPDKDAMIRQTNYPPNINDDDTNYGTYGYINTLEWTWGGYPVIYKALIGIDLSQLPENATISEAKLYLYSTGSHVSNLISGSGYKSNASYLRRITSSWSESTVTWNTAPSVTTSNQATLANSTSASQDYVVDVTNLIKDIQANPSTSDGLMFGLVTEEYYTKMQFASSDHATSSLHPKLEITYTTSTIFPDVESFEFTDTKWEDTDGDNIDWTLLNGSTPSGSTGPSSASHGKYFAYVEATGNTNKTAYLISPSYDLSDKDNATLSFDYHMYGSAMGQLQVHVSTNDGTSWSSSSIWSKSGNQGNSWETAEVNLSAYLDETILLRFKAITGSSDASDMALDNIRLSTTTEANPADNENHIVTTAAMSDRWTSGPLQRSVHYFDGLGRSWQEVSVGSSPGGKDMVKPMEYDDYGRAYRDYLPFAAGDDEYGTFRDYESSGDDVLGMQEDFFQDQFSLGTNDPYAYARTVYENSPMNRVLAQGSPAEDWSPIEETSNASEHVQEFEYENNAASSVRCFTVNTSTGALQNSTSYYSANTLYKSTHQDEDGNETEEYKDKLGKVILKRSIDGSDILSTYYVYDDFGLLRYVIPPKALGDNEIPDTNEQAQLCYYYEYDSRNRMIEKKLPSVDPVYMVYDTRDRLVLVQDGELRNDDEWLITVYDELNRPAVSGIWDGSSFTFPTDISTIENYQNFEATWNSNNHDYYLSSAIYSNTTVQSKTYYDEYDFAQSSFYSGLGFNTSDNIDSYEDNDGTSNGYYDTVIGQVTGSTTRVIDAAGTNWINTVNYYDDKYRLIQVQSSLYPQGTTMISTEYDFIGNVLQSLEKQTVNSVTNNTLYQYTYDHANRLLDTHVLYNSDDAILLVRNQYDNLGQLKQKKLHSDDNSDFTQTVDYDYNIRGWLTSINDPGSLGTDKFGMELFYQDNSSSPNSSENYNGNISGISWTHNGGSVEGYSFTYDDLNRLDTADYKTNSGSSWSSSSNFATRYSYDLNGNISTLTRTNSSGTTFDNLYYGYVGNRLDTIIDYSGNASGVNQGASGIDYAYDDNGNMEWDKNKDIEIEYNYLNLPKKIYEEGGSGDELLYIYDANGTKWLKKLTDGSNITKTMYAGSFVYTDTDDDAYDDFELDYILNPEGKIDKVTSSVKYLYHIKDHLGNTRVEFDEDGNTDQAVDYYPFGMTFGSIQGGANKYLYNGKEIQDEQLGGVNLDLYDFHARQYDPALGRTTTMDPLAENYYGMSPYSMFANNPIRFVDPTGMEFTESAWEWVNNLIGNINNQQERNSAKIADKQAQIDVGGLKAGKAKRLNKQIGRLKASNTSLEGVRGEIATLAASDQVYNVNEISSSSATTTDAVGTSTITASTSFNTNTNAVDINISSNAGMGLFSHELKHAYQFDQGQMSLGSFDIKSPSYFLYDKQDEYGGYARQGMFGTTETTLPGMYDDLPAGPIDINNFSYKGKKLSQMNAYELQHLSKGIMKQAFRYKINGVWKTFHH